MANLEQALIDDGNQIRAQFFGGLQVFLDTELSGTAQEIPKLSSDALQYGEGWVEAHVSASVQPYIATGLGLGAGLLSGAKGQLDAVGAAHLIDLKATVDTKLQSLAGNASAFSSSSKPSTSPPSKQA